MKPVAHKRHNAPVTNTPPRPSTRPQPYTPSTFSAAWAHRVGWLINHVWLSTKVVGAHHLPKHGPVILAGNHTGLLDGPVVVGAAPRGVHFLIKQELIHGLGGKILLAAGQVPVDRTGGRRALETCLGLLEKGQVVGIFPEGTRGAGRVDTIHAGVAWLAIHSGAPVLPVACLGTRRPGESIHQIPPFRRRIVVHFGSAIDLNSAHTQGHGRVAVNIGIGLIQTALANHVAAAQIQAGISLP
ncbi:MAG: 1-acyl-sn-glycerol-3-phosphate acyltransferase [Bifidobacteriaceae bacterium]|jgi:1-acyl-sn-glycerol-3-phosphate acyltransferase|nr:1-acyl-sn-glycerol-3-phosphate acyltransferase [Bifidobacteriaceae bacterium]